MRIAQLASELNSHDQFATYEELMKWLVKRARELKSTSQNSQDASFMQFLQILRAKVGFPCAFGDDLQGHPRDDNCWYCDRSICEKHCGKRLSYGSTFFSICPDCLPKLNEVELQHVAVDLEEQIEPTLQSDGQWRNHIEKYVQDAVKTAILSGSVDTMKAISCGGSVHWTVRRNTKRIIKLG